MPDAHVGTGATIGTVIATKEAIIPAAVGVDIGCGMIAVHLKGVIPPEDWTPLVKEFGRSIPAGVAMEHGMPTTKAVQWLADNPWPAGLPKGIGPETVAKQLGTLGSGNHFVEVCYDVDGDTWVVLHSGSRGVGNKMANYHIEIAKRKFNGSAGSYRLKGLPLPDRYLAWFEEGTPEFDAYIADMLWAQRYAYQNREIMMDAALRQLSYFLGFEGKPLEEVTRVNCHHNFSAVESVWGWNDERVDKAWVTRKGAIAAYRDQLGVIPGSMGTHTYITSGKGDLRSYRSSSHGAGRRLSRGQAKRTLSLDSLNEAMAGRAWNSDKALSLLDEHPEAYKNLDDVMEDQIELTEPLYKLVAMLNYKGI
jgi:tRNA-splicing ligase RtcB